jgi:hypothetical protein
MRFLFLLVLVLATAPYGQADIASVWAVNDGEKIERDDVGSRLKGSNSAWDGRKVSLFGAGNEIVAFQLIVEADAQGIQSLSASLPGLTHESGQPTIAYASPADDPTDWRDRPIQLFSLNYMEVTKPTAATWIYLPGSPSAPKNPVGWKPVQLVPENARAGRGGFPLNVLPGQNQAIWIDIYTGRDRPAGKYRGNIEVKTETGTRAIPIELELFNFQLPDRNSIHAMVFYEPPQVPTYHGRDDLHAAYHRMAHRNRVELVHAYDPESVLQAKGRFTGTDFTEKSGYAGPGENIGNQIIPASFYGPGPDYDEKDSAWKTSDAWMSFLARLFPKAITFLYMPDEPAPREYPRIRRIAGNVHSNPGPGGKLPILVTKRYVEELDGAIDIWCSGPQGFDLPTVREERSKGRQYWIYNGGRPQGGAMVIDAPATDARATIWSCFKHDIEVYFYWHGNHWRHNQQKPGDRIQNVWLNPVTFDNRGEPDKPTQDQSFANGDGVLFYPGEDILHPDQNRGIAGPCSSVTMANFRRGLQDHLYLTLARERGLESLVQEVLKATVPRVFSDAGETIGFAEDGDAYEQARLRLARALAR